MCCLIGEKKPGRVGTAAYLFITTLRGVDMRHVLLENKQNKIGGSVRCFSLSCSE